MPRRPWRPPGLQQETAEATLDAMMIGPRPEAVGRGRGARSRRPRRLVEFSQAHLEFPHDPRPDRRRARQPDLPPRPDDLDRHADRRGGRYPAGLRGRLAPRAGGVVGHGRAAGQGLDPRPRAVGVEDGRSADATARLIGKVAFVGRIADPQTGNLPIRVLVENPERAADRRPVGPGVDRGRRAARMCCRSRSPRSSTWARGRC